MWKIRHTQHHIFLSAMNETAILLILVLVTASLFAKGQNQKIDSLKTRVKTSWGKDKAIIFNKISVLYSKEADTAKAFDYFKKSVVISEKMNYFIEESGAFESLVSFYNEQALYMSSILVLKKALAYASNNKMKKGIGFANSCIGRQYLLESEYDSAEKYQQIALREFTRLKFDYGIAKVNERLGVIYMTKSNYLKALNYYYRALIINQRLKLQHETGVSLYHIGLTKLYLSDYNEAVKYILQSLKIWDKLNETANQWNCNELIGNIYIKLGNYRKALSYHRIALNIRNENIKKTLQHSLKITPVHYLGIAYSFNNIAEAYLHLNQYDSAYYYAKKGLQIKQNNRVASKNDIANSEINLGNIYTKLKKYDSAFLLINKAAATYKSLQNKSAYADALYSLGQLFTDRTQLNKAKENYSKGFKIAKEVGDKFGVEKGYRLLSELYFLDKDYKNSLAFQKLYTEMKDSILNTQTKSKIEELQIKYDVDKKEREIAHQNNIIQQKKKQIFLITLSGVLLLLLAVAIIIFIILSRKQREKLLQKENENLQKELELKNRDLVCNVSKIFAKNQVINHVAHKLIKSSDSFKQANTKLIRGVITELKQNMDETGWKEFDIRFAKVHENFYSELDRSFPNLTKTERKLCAMLKLGMSSKEIAAISMIRAASVDTSRSRLRKKLGLKSDDDLFKFLNEL